jgi:uncharacterized protein YjbI with pentapeptide repeats
VADIGMGVTGVTSLAKAIFAGAVLKSLTVSQNAIGGPCAVRLVDSAKTGVTVKKGVFAAVNGRWGEVVMDPDSGNDVKLIWLDDGTRSSYTKVDKLDPVVGSRTDLVENYSHIEQFGQAITQLSSLDISNCNFTPASIKIFTSSVSWAKAALASVNLSGADFGYCYVLGGAWSIAVGQMVTWSSHNAEIPAGSVGEVTKKHDESNWVVQFPGAKPYYFPTDTLSQPQQPCVFQAFCNSLKVSSITELNLSSCGLNSAALHIFSEYVREATAVLASVNLSGNGLTGAIKDWRGQWKEIDSDLSGFTALCTILAKVTEVNLSDCGLGPASMPELAKAFSNAEAALAQVDIRGAHVGETDLEALRAAAPEGCEVVWEPP